MNRCAIDFATAKRVGCSSFAAIEPDLSSTSTSVASCAFTWYVAFGRAKPTSSSATPRSVSAVGR